MESSPPASKKSQGLRLLVVDDEFLIRWSVREALTLAGHVVDEAGTAQEALEQLSSGPAPHVILLDYRLPDSSDLRLLETVRRVAPDSVVMMMTAFGTSDMEEGAMRLGAYRVLGKPLELRELAPLVRQAHASRPA